MARKRVAVLISGRGSNVASLIEATRIPDYPAEIVLVLSDHAEAGGLQRAGQAGVATTVVSRKQHPDRAAFEAAIDAELRRSTIDIVCLAGFMRILSPWFVQRWRDRLINIHPSLLPAFTGLDTHARALAAGAKEHGCTVHYVREGVDDGPVILQAKVPVLPGDTPEALTARVLIEEHKLYPAALALVAAGRARPLP
jgi:phosphoribosylglycinamide formyltransferase-1